MNFRKMFADLYPELKKKYDSEQYKLAQEIIAKKLTLKVSQPVLASLMGVSYDKYLDMESGTLDIPIKEYKLALKAVEGMTRVEIEPEFIEKISKFSNFAMKVEEKPAQVMEGISFNIKQPSRNELTARIERGYDHSLMTSTRTKELKIDGIDKFVRKELFEDEWQAGIIINNVNKKGIEKTASYSFDFKEVIISETPLTA